MNILSFLDNFFTNISTTKQDFSKKLIFANLQFFADYESRAQELSNDVSFVIFEHLTWDVKWGSNCSPPPAAKPIRIEKIKRIADSTNIKKRAYF